MRNPEKKKKITFEDFHKHSENKKKLWANNKVRRKYIHISQVLRRCHLVEVKKLQSKMILKHPVIVQWLKNWNVNRGCSLVLSSQFCKAHLPRVDTTIVLETDAGEVYDIKYLPRSCRLSGGWRRFSVDMRLERGDAVVLHLVEATKFKVYIIRVSSANEVTLPIHVFNLLSHVKRSDFSKADCNQLSMYRRDDLCASHQALLRKSHLAQGIQQKLIVDHPVTVKWLGKSSGYTLPLPTPFCRALLPVEDATIILETDNGQQYKIKYLAQYLRLSGGWRMFFIDMKLEVGDAIVFHLIEATKFKVYIIRKNADKVRLPVHLLKLLSHAEQRDSSEADRKHLIVYRRRSKHQISENYSCKSILFSNIKSFEEFKTSIHELIQNHELPYYALQEYYELCCSQNAFLHADLFRGINPRLNNQILVKAIRNIILDTVNLANALSICKLSTFLNKNELWDKALKTFEALGMNVSFLRARLQHLRNLAVSSEGAADRSRYEEACHERGRARDEVRKLELILSKLQTLKSNSPEDKTTREGHSWGDYAKAEISKLEILIAEFGEFFSEYDAHIETLKLKVKNHELKFKEEVSAPWLHLHCPRETTQ